MQNFIELYELLIDATVKHVHSGNASMFSDKQMAKWAYVTIASKVYVDPRALVTAR